MLILLASILLSPAFAQDCSESNTGLIQDLTAATQTEWISAVSDELERGWTHLMEEDFEAARSMAASAADRVREVAELEDCSEVQRDELLAQAWGLWNLAEGLAKAEAASGEAAKTLAHETAEQARHYGSYDQITAAQQEAVEEHAGRIYEVAKNATSPDGSTDIVQRVPYFNQYDNGINPGGSCQNTSVAMALQLYGVNIAPDTISASGFGTSTAKSPTGAAQVFNHYATRAGISQRMAGHTDGSFADLKAELDQGHPMVINGYFTAGHVVLVTGYDESGYFVNDPAGQWNERFEGGYAGQPYNGRGVHYDKAAFEQAVGTWDGSTAAPLSYTTID